MWLFLFFFFYLALVLFWFYTGTLLLLWRTSTKINYGLNPIIAAHNEWCFFRYNVMIKKKIQEYTFILIIGISVFLDYYKTTLLLIRFFHYSMLKKFCMYRVIHQACSTTFFFKIFFCNFQIYINRYHIFKFLWLFTLLKACT